MRRFAIRLAKECIFGNVLTATGNLSEEGILFIKNINRFVLWGHALCTCTPSMLTLVHNFTLVSTHFLYIDFFVTCSLKLPHVNDVDFVTLLLKRGFLGISKFDSSIGRYGCAGSRDAHNNSDIIIFTD